MPVTETVLENILTLTIDGEGERNLLTPDLLLELDESLRKFERDGNLQVAILRGAGEKHFSGGESPAHLKDALDDLVPMQGKLRHLAYPLEQNPMSYTAVYTTLFSWRTSKPVIAAITGECYGKALTLVGLHTDIRVCGKSSRFGFPLIAEGFGSGDVLLSQLVTQIPRAWVNWLVEVGEPVDARRAYQCFLVNEMIEDDRVFRRAGVIAEKIAAMPAGNPEREKFSVTRLGDMDYDDALRVACRTG